MEQLTAFFQNIMTFDPSGFVFGLLALTCEDLLVSLKYAARQDSDMMLCVNIYEDCQSHVISP